MAIIAKASGSNYTPAPAKAHPTVCVDVVDLGVLETTYQGKTKKAHKVQIIWQTEEEREPGKPFIIQKRYTLSLHEKSALRKDLESWRGKPFSDAEKEGFDVEVLIGKGCLINVIHRQTDSGVWANIAAIMRLQKDTRTPSIRGYVRVCDRKPEDAAPAQQGDAWDGDDTPPGWDEVPF